MNTNHYVGFSTATADAGRNRQWKLYDSDLIKCDLLNHFNTRIGERCGRSAFGCAIWDMIHEQKASGVVDNIRAEAERVARFDPRLLVTDVEVYEYQHGVIIAISATNRASDAFETFQINFDTRQGQAF